MYNMKTLIGAATVAGALAVPMASTAAALRPIVIGGGLVNVQITELIDDVTITVQDITIPVQAALSLAANVCGVTVNALATQFQDGFVECSAENGPTEQVVTVSR